MLDHEGEMVKIIQVFEEEKAKIDYNAKVCNKLLGVTNTLIGDIRQMDNICKKILPNADQLLVNCESIIKERINLKHTYEELDASLKKYSELQNVLKQMPEIKDQIINILKTVFASYTNNTQEFNFEEYYSRFNKDCRSVNELASRLESAYCDELPLYLEEIYSFYFDNRIQLVEKVFTKSIADLVRKFDRNYCDMFLQVCHLLSQTIRNENQLFFEIFNTSPGDKEIAIQHINSICEIAYEQLLPMIIKLLHLESLASLHKCLSQMVANNKLDCFTTTVNRLIEEINERLVFRTQVYVKENILNYTPSSGDLAYPEKLEIIKNDKKNKLKNFQSLWYPTVQRAVLSMVYLRRALNQNTFAELALEICEACIESLKSATLLIKHRHKESTLESTLFLTQHLEILEEQIKLFGIDAQDCCDASVILASLTDNDSGGSSQIN